MNFTRHEKDGIVWFTSPLFDSLGIGHFFAAKHGGVSEGDFSSLNVSTNRKDSLGKTDDVKNVRENLRHALSLIGKNEKSAAMMKQIHSAGVEKASLTAADVFDGKGDFQALDGIFTMKGNEADTLCVKTADCVPVLLYDTKNDIACAIHAGWRGTVGDICGCAVRTIRDVYGYSDAQFVAAIGPHIGSCCYEVNDTVRDAAFFGTDRSGIDRKKAEMCFTDSYFAGGENKYKISLSLLNALYLENAGVERENIDICALCTCCRADTFFSHRASGGHSGTQISAVTLR